MNCPHATAPNDEELVSCALDEEPLTGKAKEHLEHCPVCQQRLALYERINRLLLAGLYRSQCPSVTLLNHYCAGMLPPDDAITIAQHLQDCPLCAQEVEEIRRILADFDPSYISAPTQPLYATPLRIVASPVPWQLLSAMNGENDGPPIGSWPRRYRAAALHISLHLSHTGDGEFMLLGILSSVNSNASNGVLQGRSVDLFRVSDEQNLQPEEACDAMPLVTGTVDALDTIVFTALPAGTYTMIVHMPTSDIIIPELTIERS
jgi:hypothetical protein